MGEPLQAVIFDVDGTLVDSVELHARCWARAFEDFGVHVDSGKVRAQIGKGGDQLLPEFLTAEQLARFGAALDEHRSILWKREYLSRVVAFPKVRELFERIRRDGIRIGLASSAKGDELERYLEIADIADLVGEGTSADDADKSKPHPDIFEAALAKLPGVDPAKACAIGDTAWDAIAAARAGLPTIGLLTGGWDAAILRRAGCFAIYVDPADLLARYDESPIRQPAMYQRGTPLSEIVP